jgi:predicted HTH transcriptional regulator
MTEQELIELLHTLLKYPHESEWVEFKLNYHSAEEIGERISALSNSACIRNQPFGYLVFGIKDETCEIVGTTFRAKSYKKGNEDMEHWLITRLNPRIDFVVYEFDYDNSQHISLFKIPATKAQPVEFLHKSYIRIGTITRLLSEFPEKQAKIWKKDNPPFEKEIAKNNLSAQDIIQLLSTETYFDLMKLPYPTTQQGVIDKFLKEGLIVKTKHYTITKLGALLFAKNLRDFENVERKSVRVIVYKGKNKVATEREQTEGKGYAVGFIGLIDWINSQLPANEEIGKTIRKETTMYPKIAIRELVANALIHQDLTEKGFPMVEIFTDRVEISNAGTPLVSPERFIDGYLSRNEKLADIMRRMGFCEEKGSGMDKVIFSNELYQLPPINILVTENRTQITIYRYKSLNDLSKKEKIWACYQHACLKYVSNEKMTNQTLRERFKIEDHNYSVASRIIRDTIDEKLIKEEYPESNSRKYASYLPYWA